MILKKEKILSKFFFFENHKINIVPCHKNEKKKTEVGKNRNMNLLYKKGNKRLKNIHIQTNIQKKSHTLTQTLA